MSYGKAKAGEYREIIRAGSQDAYRIFDLIELRFCFLKFTRRHKWQNFHCFGQPSL